MATSPSLRLTTPPRSSNLHTPTTPKHGWEDNYQPYSPRKSARVSLQRSRAAHTPPHTLPANRHSPTSSRRIASAGTPSNTLSPPPSRMESTKNAPKASPTDKVGTVSGASTYDSTVSVTAGLAVPALVHGSTMESGQSTAILRNNGMLPTPAKTPTQKPSSVAPGIKSIARNLFPIRGETAEEAMPSPKKKGRKKDAGYTMGSFEAGDEDTQITIYTDSHDRIPEVDLSADNPFYGQSIAAQPEPTKRSSKRRKIAIPGEGEQTIEEAERREDGLIYVFRGKKIFRKFNDTEDTEGGANNAFHAEIDAALEADIPSRIRGPLTRSSVKPRLLFPTPEQIKAKEMRAQAIEDEEEAVTDIEETNDLSTPKGQSADVVATPKAPKFAPASPPITARATRSKQMDATGSPAQAERDGSRSPFYNWSIAKDVPLTRTRKRGGESLKRGGRGKKVRGE